MADTTVLSMPPRIADPLMRTRFVAEKAPAAVIERRRIARAERWLGPLPWGERFSISVVEDALPLDPEAGLRIEHAHYGRGRIIDRCHGTWLARFSTGELRWLARGEVPDEALGIPHR